MNYKKDEATELLSKLGIVLKHEDQDKDGKALLKVFLMLVTNICNPITSVFLPNIILWYIIL